MSMVATTIKGLLKIKPKLRFDSYTDQFHRIFMVKIGMISAMILGLNWLKDSMSCIIPSHHGIDGKFTAEACWIQGFFVYKELKHIPGMFGYYGIPRNFKDNGYYPAVGKYGQQEPCEVSDSDQSCLPLTKTFYLQYQWFPFYMGALAVLYYIPYIAFRFYNTDIISLKTNLKSPDVDVDGIVANYFDHGKNPVSRMRTRVLGNIFVKILYVLTNIIAFIGSNGLLNGDFKRYGIEWMNWSKQPNDLEHDYTATPKGPPNPASVLLPTFGLCQVLEVNKDIKHTLYNKHDFVCEISQNVMYQYVLLLLWFLFVIGFVVSLAGFVMEVGDHILTAYAFMAQGDQTRRVYQQLTIRECQYLEYIRKKDMTTYGKVIRIIKKQRIDQLYETDDGRYNNHVDDTNPYAESNKLLSEMNRE